ncbi:hypothetical protein ACCO45_009651 [Purpureocillium lilacinum]|uniref:Uncharacterized protein n=1 Tax=Purpureocillium lilacinum TaxID=33203 RepID=A0ACC4DKC1_PURLI
MKYTAALSVLALAATAQVCCSGLLTCLVQVLGASCNNQAYCCNTEAPVGSLINIALLNCVDIL